MTQKYLHDLGSGKGRQWPRQAATFSGLATALETTELAIVLGYAAEFGVPVSMSEFATRLPPGIDALDERVKESVLGMLWALCTDAPVRRYLADDVVPDVSELEGENVVGGPERERPSHGRGQQ